MDNNLKRVMAAAVWVISLGLSFDRALAQEDLDNAGALSVPSASDSESAVGRDPASVSGVTSVNPKRTYPGGADEEDLQVRPQLPEATLKTDVHSVQREVYKTLYNQELKDERQEPVEE